MLDNKIAQIIEKADTLSINFIEKYNKRCSIYGNSDTSVGMYLDMLLYCLKLNGLSEDFKLALYKKIINVIQSAHIIPKIMENPQIQTDITALIYYGSEDKGVSAATLQNNLFSELTTLTDKSYSFSPSHEVYYFAYPHSAGSLSLITDQNNFFTLGGWTTRIESFTIAAESVDYIVYEFNTYTTQIDFINNFKF